MRLSSCRRVGIDYIDTMDARTTIPAFDAFLAARALRLRATVIGGAALQLLQVPRLAKARAFWIASSPIPERFATELPENPIFELMSTRRAATLLFAPRTCSSKRDSWLFMAKYVISY